MRISLLDPGLQRQAGHHFDLDFKLARWLTSHGHKVKIYSHREIKEEVRVAFEPFAPVMPLFRSGPYVNPKRYDNYAGELIVYQFQSQTLAEDLEQVSASDLWLWPTITAAQLKACSIRGVKVPLSACIHTPVVSDEYPNGQIWWRDAFLASNRSLTRMNIGAIEAEHRYDYLPLTSTGRFSLFPSYFDGFPDAVSQKEVRTVGFFGHQRGEKGAHLMGELVGQLLSSGYKVIFHDSNRSCALQKRPGLNIVGFVPDLVTEIVKCDLIILPYSPDRYKRKGSGILMDAIASGVPSVVPFGTALGRWIDKTGAGTQFVELNCNQVMAAVENAKTNYTNIARAAHNASLYWKKNHGLDRFVSRMLDV